MIIIENLEVAVSERMVQAAEADGAAEKPDVVRKLVEESLFGDAVTLGAVSFCSSARRNHKGIRHS